MAKGQQKYVKEKKSSLSLILYDQLLLLLYYIILISFKNCKMVSIRAIIVCYSYEHNG